MARALPHISEIYVCSSCQKYFTLLEVFNDWECPDCKIPIHIKIKAANDFHDGHRLKPDKLMVGDRITINEHIHRLLDKKVEGNSYRLALEKYTTINVNKDDFLVVIVGGWYYPS